MFFKKKKKEPEVDLWVENELRLASEINKSKNPKDSKYSDLCYDSAKKAYYSLLGKGHSGMSMSLTKLVLNRLIDRKPLSSITDKDFRFLKPLDWEESFLRRHKLKEVYQCPRYTALFKHVKLDGSIAYSDNNRVLTIDRNGASCHSGDITKMVDKMFPITLPYWPGSPYRVYTAEFTYDSKTGEVSIEPGVYNSVYIGFMVTPEGDIITLDTFKFEDEVGKLDADRLKAKLKDELIANGLSPKVIRS